MTPLNKVDIYVCIGVPGSGKSTWARNNFSETAIIESDKVREFLYGDASIQGNPWPVIYAILKTKLEAAESPVIFDATNAKRKDRRKLLNFIKTHLSESEANIYGVYFAVNRAEAIKRNSMRERQVSPGVIDKMLSALKSAPPSTDEGFTQIILIED